MDSEKNVEKSVDNVEKVDYEELYKAAAESVKQLTAERDSLKTENDELRMSRDAAVADSAKAREMNYTLSRQLDVGAEKLREPEEYLRDLFLTPKGDNK